MESSRRFQNVNDEITRGLEGRIDPFDFMKFVDERHPQWLPKFKGFIDKWKVYQTSLRRTASLLEPLRGVGFGTVLFTYSRDTAAWQSAEDLLASSSLSSGQISSLIDPFSASDELFSHFFFEKYLELYKGHLSEKEIMALGADTAQEQTQEYVKVDWRALYEYCDTRFAEAELSQILTTAYMFRLPILRHLVKAPLLLSNPNLITFLASLPFDLDTAPTADQKEIDLVLDTVAWEFFRQLVSPRLDPLDQDAVAETIRIMERRPGEIDALKRRCVILAHELGAETNLDVLQRRIAQHIKTKVEAEVQAVLSIDKKVDIEFIDAVLADEKMWIGTATFLYSLLHGGPALTAGAAIWAISSLGSKAFKALSSARQKLAASDYAVLYRMKQ